MAGRSALNNTQTHFRHVRPSFWQQRSPRPRSWLSTLRSDNNHPESTPTPPPIHPHLGMLKPKHTTHTLIQPRGVWKGFMENEACIVLALGFSKCFLLKALMETRLACCRCQQYSLFVFSCLLTLCGYYVYVKVCYYIHTLPFKSLGSLRNVLIFHFFQWR